MVRLRYVGHKARFPVYFPIGCNSKSSIKKTVFAEPFIDLEDEDAKELIRINPGKFELESDENQPVVEAKEEKPKRKRVKKEVEEVKEPKEESSEV